MAQRVIAAARVRHCRATTRQRIRVTPSPRRARGRPGSRLRGSVGFTREVATIRRRDRSLGAIRGACECSRDLGENSARGEIVLVLCSNHRARPVSTCSIGQDRSRATWPRVVGCAQWWSVFSPRRACSKSGVAQATWGFDPPLRHHHFDELRRFASSPPIDKIRRLCGNSSGAWRGAPHPPCLTEVHDLLCMPMEHPRDDPPRLPFDDRGVLPLSREEFVGFG